MIKLNNEGFITIIWYSRREKTSDNFLFTLPKLYLPFNQMLNFFCHLLLSFYTVYLKKQMLAYKQ